MTFNKVLRGLNILAMMVLIVMVTKYANASDLEMDYELDMLEATFEGQDRATAAKEQIDECVLDSTGVCTVETKGLEEKVVKEDTPEAFKDSKITRKTKDGKTVTLDGDKYKIVPRTQKRIKKVKVKKRFRPVLIRDRVVKEKVGHDTRLSLLLGYGPYGNIDCNQSTNGSKCETDSGLNLGVQLMQGFYEREDYSIHGLIQMKSNREAGLGIGIGF